MTRIFIDNDGNVSGLADDLLDKIDKLGQKFVERVSNIEYDHQHECWVATDLDGNVIASDSIRSHVIDMEKKIISERIKNRFINK